MKDAQATITEQLDVAKDLLDQRRLDIESTLRLLEALPDDIGDAARSSVDQALQTAAAAAERDSRYEALARFALARVVVMLEKHVAQGAWDGASDRHVRCLWCRRIGRDTPADELNATSVTAPSGRELASFHQERQGLEPNQIIASTS